MKSVTICFLANVICGLCSGIAGLVASSRIYSADPNNIGLSIELDAILAVALGGNSLGGGKFSIAGSVIGAYTIQALTTTLYAVGVSSAQLSIYKAIVVVIIVSLQSPQLKKFVASRRRVFLVAYLDIQPFIVTMAGMSFARGLTAVISTDMITIKNELFLKWANFKLYFPFGGYYNKKGIYQTPYIFPTVIIALIIVAIIFLVLRYTKFGRSLYAIGGNEQSALLMGLNVRAIKLRAYILSSFLCSLGGFLYCLNSCAGFVERQRDWR